MSVTASDIGGRAASIARRRALSAGKSAIPVSNERTGSEARRNGAAAAPAVLPPPPEPAPDPQERTGIAGGAAASCREQARARRAQISRNGRGDAPAGRPVRPARIGAVEYAPKVAVSETFAGQTVTGIRVAQTERVTGDARGAGLPVSGTASIGRDSGASWRTAGPKVGLARTARGLVVSGTLVRSSVRITGDEAGASATITGEADQLPGDDLTARRGGGERPAAQFARQTQPHGASVFGTNLGRSAGSLGSRERLRETAIETTERGLPITGSAIGRSGRVTGDEAGACRRVTGDQYLAPDRAQAECGGASGGTAPARMGRLDPVTGAKVALTRTWSGGRVTGVDLEHHRNVTGTAPGTCAAITGTAYNGSGTIHAWCDDPSIESAEQRLPRRAAAAVTGDVPSTGNVMTGASRGAQRDLTGTPYANPGAAAAPRPEHPVAAIDERFSVTSPQRASQLRAGDSRKGVTGVFAIENAKLTGNLEFVFVPRRSEASEHNGAARLRITGEGRTTGRTVSGEAWAERANVTGTEGFTASDRNPSLRGGKPHPFAGAVRFKALASEEEPKHLVTGMFGYSSDSAAKVTLSGGAQG